MTYYVRMATRGSAKTGSPRQALNYITDAHDIRRDTTYSDAELHYIARMDPGWKTDLEGGRVPLVGFGALAGELDEKKLFADFEESCLPYHDIRGTTGYKSITLTLPKEVSLFADGHREEAKTAMNAAIRKALDRAFAGYRYTAVAAIHTRNQAGEIHYHAHVLVGKFAQKLETGRTYSLGTRAGGNTGRRRLLELKLGWQEGIEKEFRERLSLGVEQKTPRSSVSLVMPDGTRLSPLNRESRRMLEKEISPTFTETSKEGHAISRRFHWSAMDDRIFEIASGARGASAWDAAAFKEVFPNHARYLSRYEARVATLKSVGYLSTDGAIAEPFRVHFAAHHGVLTPELQRVRIDLLHRLAQDKATQGNSTALRPTQFWTQVQRYEDLRRRVERLGYSKDDVARIFERAKAKKPTRETLQLLRADAQRKASLLVAGPGLPKTKSILRAYVDLQKSKVERIYLISTGLLQFWKLGDRLAQARHLKKVAERDLFFAKEKRLAQVGRALRPVIWLVRVAMPKEARRLDQAITRCARLANQQQVWQAGRAATQRAYAEWHRDEIQRPLAELKNESRSLKRPIQLAEMPRLEGAQSRITTPDNAAADVFRRGYQALTNHPDCEPKVVACISAWVGKEDELVRHVLDQSKGNPTPLTRDEYAAAVRIGRVGNLLTAAEKISPLKVGASFESQRRDIDLLAARLGAFGYGRTLTTANVAAISPSYVREQLHAARRAGLLDEGPSWTFKGSAARNIAQDISREVTVSRSREPR